MPRNAPEGVFSAPAAHKPRRLDHVRERLRYLHYSLRTERAFADWIKHYNLYRGRGLVIKYQVLIFPALPQNFVGQWRDDLAMIA